MSSPPGRESLIRIGQESITRLGLFPLAERTRLRRYAWGAAALLLAEALARLLHPAIHGEAYLLFYLPAVIAAAWYGGFGPGIFSTVAGAGIVASRSAHFTASEIESLVIFILSGIMISLLYAALRTTLGWMNEILESTHDAFILLDHEGRFRYVNQEAEKIWSRRREDLLGRELKMVFPQAVGSEILRAIDRSLKEQSPASFVTMGPISKRWIELRIRPCASGVSVYFHDVTSHKKTESELVNRVDQGTARLKEVNDELETFTYSASHDLRGPVRKILSYCGLIAERAGTELSKETHDWLRRIVASAEHLDRIIDEMKNLAEATQRRLHCVTVDLSSLARELIEEKRRQDVKRRVAVIVEPGLTASADPALVRIALHSLIDNAWKFTSAADEARIEFGSRTTTEGPAFFVKDNGVGFDMAHSSKVFLPFERLNQVEGVTGMGVGLALAQRIIHRHGGKIWVESSPGMGATFYITLPPKGA